MLPSANPNQNTLSVATVGSGITGRVAHWS